MVVEKPGLYALIQCCRVERSDTDHPCFHNGIFPRMANVAAISLQGQISAFRAEFHFKKPRMVLLSVGCHEIMPRVVNMMSHKEILI